MARCQQPGCRSLPRFRVTPAHRSRTGAVVPFDDSPFVGVTCGPHLSLLTAQLTHRPGDCIQRAAVVVEPLPDPAMTPSTRWYVEYQAAGIRGDYQRQNQLMDAWDRAERQLTAAAGVMPSLEQVSVLALQIARQDTSSLD